MPRLPLLYLLIVISCSRAFGAEIYTWGTDLDGSPPYLCLGSGKRNETRPTAVASLPDVELVSICAGAGYTAALASNGSIFSWGGNSDGVLGSGTNTSTGHATLMPWNETARQISCGWIHMTVLTREGTVFSWGSGRYYQLGVGWMDHSLVPLELVWVDPSQPASVRFVAAYFYNSAAIGDKGQVWTWGYNNHGQLGIGIIGSWEAYPNAVVWGFEHGPPQPEGGCLSIGGGSYFTVALGADQQVYAWGSNENGQLGQGPAQTSYQIPYPLAVVWPATISPRPLISDIAAGVSFVLATDGSHVYTWGASVGSYLTSPANVRPPHPAPEIHRDRYIHGLSTPVQVEWLNSSHPTDTIVSLTATSVSVAAITKSGELYTWGANTVATIGDGTYANNAPYPVKIQLGETNAGTKLVAGGCFHVAAVACINPMCNEALPSFTAVPGSPTHTPSPTESPLSQSTSPTVSFSPSVKGATTTLSATASQFSFPGDGEDSNGVSKTVVALAVSIPVGVLCIAFLAGGYLLWKRTRRRQDDFGMYRIDARDPDNEYSQLLGAPSVVEENGEGDASIPRILTPTDASIQGASLNTTPVRQVLRSPRRKEHPKTLFISYGRSKSTTEFARRLKASLTSRGYTVWMDEDSIRSGQNFMEAIGAAVEDCEGLVPLIDTKYCESSFCKQELHLAKFERKPVFPCFLEEVTMTSDMKYALVTVNHLRFDTNPYDEMLEALVSGLEHENISRTWNHRLHENIEPPRRLAILSLLVLSQRAHADQLASGASSRRTSPTTFDRRSTPPGGPPTPFPALPPHAVDRICYYVAGGN